MICLWCSRVTRPESGLLLLSLLPSLAEFDDPLENRFRAPHYGSISKWSVLPSSRVPML